MYADLIPHPDHPCPALQGLRVEIRHEADGSLLLRYTLSGTPNSLSIPSPQVAGPVDELWRHTCCEAFIGGPGETYREFNFSPSGQWAVYDFHGYRQRDMAWQPATAPTIRLQQSADRLELEARIPAALIPAGAESLGLTAIIESADGSLGYWSLRHPAGKPDFHHREGLALPFPLGIREA